MEDFVNLDIALGGTGTNDQSNTALRDKYVGIGTNQWGGTYGGGCLPENSPYNQGSYAFYWSQTEYNADYGYRTNLGSNGIIQPQSSNAKNHVYALRCVK